MVKGDWGAVERAVLRDLAATSEDAENLERCFNMRRLLGKPTQTPASK